MGAEAMGTIQADLKFNDGRVCRNFICGTCPHDLFTNTRMDLGACPHTHSKKLKDDYERAREAATSSTNTEDLKYTLPELDSLMAEYERNIFGFVDECDRRIRAAQRRLEKTPEENNKTTALMRDIGEIQTAYEAAMAEVEALGESGQIEQSMEENTKAEALKAEKLEKERELQLLTDNSGASGHQKLRVCDICGAYLSILDSDRRLADHFGGKMHLGYLDLRQKLEGWRLRPDEEVPKLLPSAGGPPRDGPRDGPLSNAPNGAPSGGYGRPPPADAGWGDRARPAAQAPRSEDRDRRDDRDRDRRDDRGADRDRRKDDHRSSSSRHESSRHESSRYDDRWSEDRHGSSSSRRTYDDRDRDSRGDSKRSRHE